MYRINRQKSDDFIFRESIWGGIFYQIFTFSGPLLYLFFSISPWWLFNQNDILPDWLNRLSRVPAVLRFSRDFIKPFAWLSQEKSHQAGPFRLYANSSLTGEFDSAVLEFESFSFHWLQDRPLVLVLSDGREVNFFLNGYSKQDNGFVLKFSKDLYLNFYIGEESLSGLYPMQRGVRIELITSLPLASADRLLLPWDLDSSHKLPQVDGSQVSRADGWSLVAIDKLNLTADSYLEIPLRYYSFLESDDEPILWNFSSHEEEVVNKNSHKFLFLWQGHRDTSVVQQTARAKYERLITLYAASLLRQMKDKLHAYEVPNADWAAFYLELLLEGYETDHNVTDNRQAYYEQERAKMESIVRSNRWNSLSLTPYLGIESNALEKLIDADTESINLVRAKYRSANWSFDNQIYLADMLFNYGQIELFLDVVRLAVSMRTASLSNKEQFYLLGFLWRAASIYPRNGIVSLEDIQRELKNLILRINKSWEHGFPQGLSMSYILDVLKLMQNEELALPESYYSIVFSVLQLMDTEGRLPEIYKGSGGHIPAYRSWSSLTPALQQPRGITVVPGFSLWTADRARGTFELGQPISIDIENLPVNLGHKLLLLRGVYFQPQEIIFNGSIAKVNDNIPIPKLGQQASWYYNVKNKFLAIELPVGKNNNVTNILIR